MGYCKYCGEKTDGENLICEKCSVSANTEQMQNNKKAKLNRKLFGLIEVKYLLVIFGVIAAVAVFIVIFVFATCEAKGCSAHVVSGSRYCSSHKCAVSYCSFRHTDMSIYCAQHQEAKEAQESISTSAVKYKLNISNVYIRSEYGFTYASGTITNNSDYTVSYIKIKGSFKNRMSEVVDTDWTYAVDSVGLAPGESCKWEMSVDKDYTIKTCEASVVDFRVN